MGSNLTQETPYLKALQKICVTSNFSPNFGSEMISSLANYRPFYRPQAREKVLGTRLAIFQLFLSYLPAQESFDKLAN